MSKQDARALLRVAAAEVDKADRLLEIAAVARRLKRCEETIRRYIRQGLLPVYRAPARAGSRRGGNYLVPESAVRHFLATGSNFFKQPPA